MEELEGKLKKSQKKKNRNSKKLKKKKDSSEDPINCTPESKISKGRKWWRTNQKFSKSFSQN